MLLLASLSVVVAQQPPAVFGESPKADLAIGGARQGRPATVRVGLYSSLTPQKITITGYGGLRMASRSAQGTVTFQRKGAQVMARDGEGAGWQAGSLMLASRAGRWMDVEVPGYSTKRTVGYIEIRPKGEGLQIINIVPLETYVLGIVKGELGSLNFNPESLKAQIVASRSYVLATPSRHAASGYEYCDGPHCQVYAGTGEINAEFKKAMEETRGQFLAFYGQPAPGFYHDTCGGRTASVKEVWGVPKLPYLGGVEDTYCRTSPRASWNIRVDRVQLKKCFLEAGWMDTQDALSGVKVASLDSSGRADQICIQSNRQVWVPASDVRREMIRYFKKEVLPSTFFTVTKERHDFIFSGKGWGHGVGLCQWGAIHMARAGKTYRQILTHYYPGTALDRLPEFQYPQYANAIPID